ncbi:MAG: F0F1 ATP synthase subunit A, partial [Desulfomonilia bacterium]|nr:F0F1 ATP synthase subunit A [Desulfomonilia bacterium]
MEHGFLILDFINKPLYHFLHEHFNLTDGNHMVQVTFTWFYMIVIILLSFLVARNIKLVPGRLQNFLEVVIGGLKGLLVDTMGEKGMIFFPLMARSSSLSWYAMWAASSRGSI